MVQKKHKVILVVEDEISLQRAIKRKLRDHNFQVVTARKMKEAWSLLTELERVDVIWLDHYLLGNKNGLDFVVKIKEHSQYKKIPIFVVSNTAGADKIKSYIKLGIKKYYTKSNFGLGEIINDLEEQL